MSWIRSSKIAGLAALLAILVLLGTAGVATAQSSQTSASDVPEEAQVGDEMDVTVTVEDPYAGDAPQEWDLRVTTEADNVSWTITERFQGDTAGEQTSGDRQVTQTVPIDERGDTITIRIRGAAPEIGNYSYQPRENFTLVSVERVTGNNAETLGTWNVHHYTNESQTARQAIDSARQAIQQAGGDDEAEETLRSAISSYNNGNFENARNLAGDAEEQAQQTQQSQQTMQLLLYGGVGAVFLVLVIGGVWYYRQQQDDYDKLR